MAGQFPEWLATLRKAGKGPVALADGWPVAVRGLEWELEVELPGDWTGATLAGTVSASPDAGTDLVEFAVTGPSVSGGYTYFTLSLASGTGADSTGALPGDGDASGEEEFPFMLRITPSGGYAETVCGGMFPVIGKV